MGKFQLITIIFFISIGVLGLLMFSGLIKVPWKKGPDLGGGAKAVTVTVWGTLDAYTMGEALDVFNDHEQKNVVLEYTKIDPSIFEIELLRAITAGEEPDMIFVQSDLLVMLESELSSYPFENLEERLFRELFIEGAETLLNLEGVPLMPIVADPIVMYWNRDIFTKERIIKVPESWDDLMSFAKDVTERDQRGRILQSAVSLGESSNINHSKDILSLLFMQTGNNIVRKQTDHEGRLNFEVVLSASVDEEGDRGEVASALAYYVGFADPAKPHYSWNGSFLNSIETFAAGNLAVYFGRASDMSEIDNLNPHLNYDVAPVPQLHSDTSVATAGAIYGFGVLKGSKNKTKAFEALYKITISDSEAAVSLSETLFLPPVRRDLLNKGNPNPFMSTFYNEAIILRLWPDPNSTETDKIFDIMIDDVLSKRDSADDAVRDAANRIMILIKK